MEREGLFDDFLDFLALKYDPWVEGFGFSEDGWRLEYGGTLFNREKDFDDAEEAVDYFNRNLKDYIESADTVLERDEWSMDVHPAILEAESYAQSESDPRYFQDGENGVLIMTDYDLDPDEDVRQVIDSITGRMEDDYMENFVKYLGAKTSREIVEDIAGVDTETGFYTEILSPDAGNSSP